MPEEIEVIKIAPLSLEELNELALAESKIRESINIVDSQFKVIGAELARIRDKKLYLNEFTTFAGYVQGKWKREKTWGYQLIEASEIAEKFSAIAEIPTEAVARELSKIGRHEQMKVVKAANSIAQKAKTPITPKIVKQVATKLGVEPVNHHKGWLYEQMMKAKELHPAPSTPKNTVPINESSVTSCHTDSAAEKIEACYQANKTKWNTPPPPSPRSIIDTIIQALQ